MVGISLNVWRRYEVVSVANDLGKRGATSEAYVYLLSALSDSESATLQGSRRLRGVRKPAVNPVVA